jgi:hypothetical protein
MHTKQQEQQEQLLTLLGDLESALELYKRAQVYIKDAARIQKQLFRFADKACPVGSLTKMVQGSAVQNYWGAVADALDHCTIDPRVQRDALQDIATIAKEVRALTRTSQAKLRKAMDRDAGSTKETRGTVEVSESLSHLSGDIGMTLSKAAAELSKKSTR